MSDTMNKINSKDINNNNKLITNEELILPFGYEDDSFMNDEECFELLSVRYDITPIINKIYSHLNNCNFIRNNVNKDIITRLDENMDISTCKFADFYDMLIEIIINFLKRLLVRIRENMTIKEQIVALKNIEYLYNKYKKNDKYTIKEIKIYLDNTFRNLLKKKAFKKYFYELCSNNNCKQNGLDKVSELQDMNTKIYYDFNNLVELLKQSKVGE